MFCAFFILCGQQEGINMDKKVFKDRLAENEYENINVLQLFGLQDDVYVGGSIEIYHIPIPLYSGKEFMRIPSTIA